LFATVAERDPHKLKNGYVQVQFVDSNQKEIDLTRLDSDDSTDNDEDLEGIGSNDNDTLSLYVWIFYFLHAEF